MPSPKNHNRDYKQEARTAKQRGEQGTGSNSGSAKRHRARRKAIALGMIKPGSSQDVHHKKPISRGGGNSRSNLQVASKSKNRSFKRNSDGSIKKA